MAGGSNGVIILSSAELLGQDSSGWEMTTRLPRAVIGARGVTAGGRVFITGISNGFLVARLYFVFLEHNATP